MAENMFKLYKQLKDAGFPQGGQGHFLQSPMTDEQVYIPTHEEILLQFLGDPADWQKITDALAGAWLEHRSTTN